MPYLDSHGEPSALGDPIEREWSGQTRRAAAAGEAARSAQTRVDVLRHLLAEAEQVADITGKRAERLWAVAHDLAVQVRKNRERAEARR